MPVRMAQVAQTRRAKARSLDLPMGKGTTSWISYHREERVMLHLKVSGMTCEHCVSAVTRAVRAVPGAGNVAVSLDRGEVTVAGDPDQAAVRAAITEEGYEVTAA